MNLPDAAPVAALASPYLDGLACGELRYQACADCGQAQHLARFACRRCSGTRLRWQRAAGTGVVHALSTVSRAPSATWREQLPYTLLVVTLDEGSRLMGHGPAALKIGDPVQAEFFRFDDHDLVRFVARNRPGENT